MANSSKGKGPHSGAHGPARKNITERNKARRRARWVKKQKRLGDVERQKRLQIARAQRYLASRARRKKDKAAPVTSVQINQEQNNESNQIQEVAAVEVAVQA